VTRPPDQEWHSRAIELLRSTDRANIVLVKDLHAKIYTAQTKDHAFAMMGSANFTKQSMENREIGLLINHYAQGKQLVSQLTREAADLYRTPSRQQICKSKL
jgi:HKD family nuclease